jgi:hypothetical protein
MSSAVGSGNLGDIIGNLRRQTEAIFSAFRQLVRPWRDYGPTRTCHCAKTLTSTLRVAEKRFAIQLNRPNNGSTDTDGMGAVIANADHQ